MFRTLMMIAAALMMVSAAAHAQPLNVVTTTTDLASLARAVGGEDVQVTALAKGTEDAHFVEARPSFVKQAHEADVWVQNGLELEAGWAPVILQNARNARILPGAAGYIDASRAVTPLDVLVGPVDRSRGDVHPAGNPHYLLDPMNGLRVARLLRDRFSQLRPDRAEQFARRFEQFEQRLGEAMVGSKLMATYRDIEKLMVLHSAGTLEAFLQEQGRAAELGGWVAAMKPLTGRRVVGDHNMWRYFTSRFGLIEVAYMESKPGLAPTTSHLRDVVELVKRQDVQMIIAGPYFDPRHARFLADATGARAVTLAHQVGAVEGAAGYLEMFELNIRRLTQ